MIAILVLGTISMILAFLARYKQFSWGLRASFILIFIFLALRYNYGNDYKNYLTIYLNLTNFGLDDISDIMIYEPGWIFINILFQPLGYFLMIAAISLVNCLIYYHVISKYVPVKYYWFAIFIYIFYPGFMLIHLSAMRQSIAIMIFMYSLNFIIEKKLVRYLLCILMASIFHYSAILLLPLYFINIINGKIRLLYGSILGLIYASIFFFGGMIMPVLMQGIVRYVERYEFYQTAGVVNTGFGFLYYSALFVVVMIFENLQERKNAIIFKISLLSFLLMPLALIIDMTGRMGMYFSPATIIVYPLIAQSENSIRARILFPTTIIIFTIYQFVQFMYSDIYRAHYEIYQTIISA